VDLVNKVKGGGRAGPVYSSSGLGEMHDPNLKFFKGTGVETEQ